MIYSTIMEIRFKLGISLLLYEDELIKTQVSALIATELWFVQWIVRHLLFTKGEFIVMCDLYHACFLWPIRKMSGKKMNEFLVPYCVNSFEVEWDLGWYPQSTIFWGERLMFATLACYPWLWHYAAYKMCLRN